MSTRPPGAFGSTTSSNGASSASSKATFLDEEEALIPPWFGFFKSVIGIIVGLGANGWQAFTTFIAFQILIADGSPRHVISQSALLIVSVVCVFIAASIQLGVVLFVFKVGKQFKNRTAVKSDENLLTKLKHTAVAMDNRDVLFVIFVVIAFVGDTIGDVTLMNTYTDNPFVIFFYIVCLYAASTVLLVKALESFWASQMAYMQWRAMVSKLYK